MMIVYGINPVLEVLRSHPEDVKKLLLSLTRDDRVAKEIFSLARSMNIPVERVEREVIGSLAGVQSHQGVCVIVRGGYRYRDLEDLIAGWREEKEPALFVILDSIQDPQNMGTLIRTAHSAGVHGVIIPRDRTCAITSTVVKASSGATEYTPVARVVNLARTIGRLKKEGIWVVGLEAGSGKDIYTWDLTDHTAIVLGSEGRGLRRLIRESCDVILSIPMKGRLSSLNVSQAGAIVLFEARRQRLYGRK